MIQRYEKFIILTTGFNYNKLNYFKINTISQQLKKLHVQIGLYKINNIFLQYSFLLSTLTSLTSLISFQTHGKRKKKTFSFNAILLKNYYYYFLDKFLHQLLPEFVDFKFLKFNKQKSSNQYNSYSLRFRYKIGYFDEFIDLLESTFYNTHKGIYLPLTLNFKFNKIESITFHEFFLRMIRIPIF